MAGPTSRCRWLALPLLVLTSLAFFAAMTWVHIATNWSGFAAVFLAGSGLFFCLGILYIGIGLWQRRARPAVGGLAILLPLVALGLPVGMEIHWIGSKTTTLSVMVRDAQTNRPLPGATVKLLASKDSSSTTEGRTDEGGEVHLSHTFTAVGTDSLFRKRGVYSLWRETLEVEAEGYEAVRVSLEEYTGPVWKLYGPPIPPVEVRLRAK